METLPADTKLQDALRNLFMIADVYLLIKAHSKDRANQVKSIFKQCKLLYEKESASLQRYIPEHVRYLYIFHWKLACVENISICNKYWKRSHHSTDRTSDSY